MNKSRPHQRILITNDDGIHAPGLKLLEEIAHTITDDVWIVAPDAERSGAGHSISLTLPIRMQALGKFRQERDAFGIGRKRGGRCRHCESMTWMHANACLHSFFIPLRHEADTMLANDAIPTRPPCRRLQPRYG